MVYIEMEKLLKNTGSRYKLVILASRRTLELSEGKPKLVDLPGVSKLALIALKEIEEGKIGLRITTPGKVSKEPVAE
ncbi:MAG: DNA-directed RNA polymerase subunit omega [Candidatus Omnitrophota bacterium]